MHLYGSERNTYKKPGDCKGSSKSCSHLPLISLSLPFCQPHVLDSILICIFLIYELILERVGKGRRERETERNMDLFVGPLVYAFIGCLLYVPWPEIEPSPLVYWDNALTNWATHPARATCISFMVVLPRFFNANTSICLINIYVALTMHQALF